ncbi:unnamed protein product [Agarophyton chilense]
MSASHACTMRPPPFALTSAAMAFPSYDAPTTSMSDVIPSHPALTPVSTNAHEYANHSVSPSSSIVPFFRPAHFEPRPSHTHSPLSSHPLSAAPPVSTPAVCTLPHRNCFASLFSPQLAVPAPQPPAPPYHHQQLPDLSFVVKDDSVHRASGHIACDMVNSYRQQRRPFGKSPHDTSRPVNSAHNSFDPHSPAHQETPALSTSSQSHLLGHSQGTNRVSSAAYSSCTGRSTLLMKRTPNCGWTKAEHFLFLKGLHYHGRGNYNQIAALVRTKSLMHILSHAQRYFERQYNPRSVKSSVHDLNLHCEEMHDERNKARQMHTCRQLQFQSQGSDTTVSQPPLPQCEVALPVRVHSIDLLINHDDPPKHIEASSVSPCVSSMGVARTSLCRKAVDTVCLESNDALPHPPAKRVRYHTAMPRTRTEALVFRRGAYGHATVSQEMILSSW